MSKFCTNCGKESAGKQKFCTSCGTPFLKVEEKKAPEVKTATVSHASESSWSVGRIVTILVILAIVGFGIWGSLDEDSITTNNEGLSSFESGDSQTAINQLQQASQDAVTSDTKLNTLKNLGYVYSSEGQYEQALQSFREALTNTSEGSFDYYLVSGEIALLEGKPNAAQISYNKAYELRPNDFQINNALNLFYLDLSEVAPYYSDYTKALKHGQKAYDVSDDLVKNTARQNLGIAHFFNENYDQAISLFSYTDVNKEPYMAYWLGWAYAAKGDVSNAKFYFQKAADAGIEMEQEAYDYLYSY